MAILNKAEATTGPNGVINVIPTNGSGNIQATNFHTYFGDLINWLFPGASTDKGAVLTASATDYSLEWNVLVPVGTIAQFATNMSGNVPDGWVWCNGDEVDIATYPDLFALIGYSYNIGANVPAAGCFFLPHMGQYGESWIYDSTTTFDQFTPTNSVGDDIANAGSIHTMIKY